MAGHKKKPHIFSAVFGATPFFCLQGVGVGVWVSSQRSPKGCLEMGVAYIGVVYSWGGLQDDVLWLDRNRKGGGGEFFLSNSSPEGGWIPQTPLLREGGGVDACPPPLTGAGGEAWGFR